MPKGCTIRTTAAQVAAKEALKVGQPRKKIRTRLYQLRGEEGAVSLDTRKLAKVRRLANGTVVAQCPACAAAGQDRQGQHLVVYPDGRFGCVVYPGAEGHPHRQEIWRAAGERTESRRPPLVLKFTLKLKRES